MQGEDKIIPSQRSTISVRLLNCQKLLKLIFQLAFQQFEFWNRTVSKLIELVFIELASNVNYSQDAFEDLKPTLQGY